MTTTTSFAHLRAVIGTLVIILAASVVSMAQTPVGTRISSTPTLSYSDGSSTYSTSANTVAVTVSDAVSLPRRTITSAPTSSYSDGSSTFSTASNTVAITLSNASQLVATKINSTPTSTYSDGNKTFSTAANTVSLTVANINATISAGAARTIKTDSAISLDKLANGTRQ